MATSKKGRLARLGFTRPNPWMLIAGGVIGLGGGPALIFTGLALEDVAAETAIWEPVTATILESEVRSSTSGGGGGSMGQGHSAKTTTHSARVVYSYSVGGVEHQSDRISLGALEGSAEETVKRFPAGSSVVAYHDPTAPGEAVLVRGMPGGRNPVGQIGIVACLIGLVMIVAAFRQDDD